MSRCPNIAAAFIPPRGMTGTHLLFLKRTDLNLDTWTVFFILCLSRCRFASSTDSEAIQNGQIYSENKHFLNALSIKHLMLDTQLLLSFIPKQNGGIVRVYSLFSRAQFALNLLGFCHGHRIYLRGRKGRVVKAKRQLSLDETMNEDKKGNPQSSTVT